MGYYIQTNDIVGKAKFLEKYFNGEILVDPPASYQDIPTGKALIVVVENLFFEAAAFCYNEAEFQAFLHDPTDQRAKTCVLIDREIAEQESGYARIQRITTDEREESNNAKE